MKKILIVDDRHDQREFLREVLEMNNNFEIFDAESGEAAVCLLGTNTFDLIISDIEMPRGDGFWLLNKVKLIEHLPVILLSGSIVVNEIEVLSAGAVDFFTKPYSITALLKSVRQWLH